MVDSDTRPRSAALTLLSSPRQQGRFLEIHDRLFQEPSRLSATRVRAHAGAIGLDVRLFDQCASGEGALRVAADLAEADRLGITGTPTFLFGHLQEDRRVRVVLRTEGTIQRDRLAQMLSKKFGI